MRTTLEIRSSDAARLGIYSYMLVVLSYGAVNYNRQLQLLPAKLNSLPALELSRRLYAFANYGMIYAENG
jgi:hypothetical protein